VLVPRLPNPHFSYTRSIMCNILIIYYGGGEFGLVPRLPNPHFSYTRSITCNILIIYYGGRAVAPEVI